MGVKVYHNGNWVEFSTGSNASADFLVQDEGNDLVGLATALNFVGSGVTASNTTGNPSTKQIEITGVTTFLALSDTPTSYVGTAGSVVTVKSSEDGLVFLPADSSGLGRDNYVSSATFTSLVGGGTSLTLGYTGPDDLSPITANLNIGTLGIGFTQLTDTPANYTGHAHKFVRVNKDGSTSNGTALEFVTQIPGTAVGAAGNNLQVQFNKNNILTGAGGLEFTEETNTYQGPYLTLKPNNTTESYGGGEIGAETNLIPNSIHAWNRASITADGGLELLRRRIDSPVGGPYIDFKAQLDGNGNPVDFDARIQMDYANGWVDGQAINTGIGSYSSITFQTGGNGYYSSSNPNGRVIERLRIGRYGEIGIMAGPTVGNGDVDNTRSDADIYGNAGQVLTSNGVGNSVSWTNKNNNTNSTFNSGLIVAIPATQPGLNLGNTVNIANFNSNTSVNTSKLLIYNRRSVAPPNNAGWENTTMNIQRQIDVTNFAYIQFGRGNGIGGKHGGTLHFGTGDAHAAVERVEIDPDGYLIAKSDIRVRRTGGVAGTQNNGGIYFGDSNNNYIFGEDSVETLTFNSSGSGNFIQDEQVTATNGATAYVKSWNSGTYVLTIYNRTGTFVDGNTVTGAGGASWVIASNGFTTNDADVLTFATAGSEKLRITKDGALGLNGASYGTAGQVLTSNGPNAAPTWGPGGGGGGSDPVGTIVVWSGSVASIPSDYQLCDGSAASTTELQAITGANVPDLRDRFIIGANDVAAESSYPGVGINSTGGSANATLPTHSHDKGTLAVTGGDHSHSYTFLNQNVAHGGGSSAYGRTTTSASTGSSGSLTMSVSGSTGSEGSSATNANLPPYYALCYIIKHTATSGSGGGGGGSVATSIQTFTTAGSHTYTPTSGTTSIIVHCIGGGGGTGSARSWGFSGGGGAGGVGIRHYNSTEFGTSAAITVGAGGAGGAGGHSSSNGGDGFDTTFDPNGTGVTLTGGKGSGSTEAGHMTRTAGGNGGGATNAEITLNGEFGMKSNSSSDGSNTQGVDGHFDKPRALYYAKAGSGGYGHYGLGGRGTISDNALGTGQWYAGEAGYAGAVIIYEFGGSGGGGGASDKISEGNTEAEVVDTGTGTNGHFKVTTEGTEQLRITHNGIVNMGRAVTDNPVTATGNVNAGIKLLGSTSSSTPGDAYALMANAKDIVGIFNRTNVSGGGRIIEYKYNATVVGAVESDSNDDLILLGESATRFKVGNTEKLSIEGTDSTFANSNDIVLNAGGGGAEATQVKGVINMGTSYKDTTTTQTGTGHYSAVKLFLYKDTSVDNVYGLGVSDGIMEIQSQGAFAFYAGKETTTPSGSRTKRLQITDSGNVNINASSEADWSQSSYTLRVFGSIGATSISASSKSFVIDHPTKENHTLRHGCLEGPEHAVYVRGKTSGSVINLPDYWVGLVHEDSITVNLTPIGNKRVWVESINNNSVTVGSDDSTEYFYTIFGERKDIDKIVIEEEK